MKQLGDGIGYNYSSSIPLSETNAFENIVISVSGENGYKVFLY